ncbi:ABC transporter I family member 11, chloroplastic isoform X1 [Solanum tuberosum]|uniref:ABC transporter I family member 11, chloroplastic isoform X1 n=1 Tax=Solanum tuberosum TaxID=4113 RepID=UPI0003D26300|nr:PREDICTED: ABC transporter I family member 11, chloroplastic isoform X1 [Solanum tuberosum]XP_006365028.1 PREDICTED: ABC transporter I family member 11, chloroplastic isoform X1 [Solanum tuberosum]XP_015159730.1 PREDICTED: ABC transporter I family member 11, chloroplastic isoform X1 [Solanum tuberosum]XP_015159731.1 PREDICTED: ABC transporter I family member 11, chloroplastic isoform X1 [Solanum tuberosum]
MGSIPLPSLSLLISSSNSSIFGRSSTFSYPPGRFRKAEALSVSCDYSCFEIRDVSYRPPGTKIDLLSQVNLSIPEKRHIKLSTEQYHYEETRISNADMHLKRLSVDLTWIFCSFGLIFGRSGSGKTTLLQLIAGLSKPTSGSIYVQRYSDDDEQIKSPEPLQPERVGIVFQFPERYFVADTVLDEVTFGWPRQKGGLQLRELLASRLQKAIMSVGLTGISLDKDPHSLSGGYKRRLALAIQLVQTPDLLILDEPLAGLDWKARADVAKLLKDLKKELTLLVVSHDLKELASLVDQSWRMEMGGALKREPLPI